MMLLVSQSGDHIYNMDNLISVYVKYDNAALTPDKRKYYIMAETVGQDEVIIAEYSSRRQAVNEVYEISMKEAGGESPHVLREDT